MKVLTKIIFAVCVGLMFSMGAFAQENNDNFNNDVQMLKQMPLKGMFGLSFTNSVPQNEFYDNIKRSGPGLSLYGAYNFAPVPISVGLQGDFFFYGSDEKTFAYRNPGGWIERRDTVSYNNFVIPITAFVQFRPNVAEYLYPYFELFGGFNMISASSDYSSSLGTEDSKTEFTASWNYGVGAGMMIKLVDFVTLPSFYSRMLLDVKARYMRGTEAKYYMVKQINNDTSPEFRKGNSKTDMATFQVGIVFEF